MSEAPGFVLDTTVLVSAAILPGSPPGRALWAALGSGRLLTSDALMAEVRDVLRRPKFDRYAPLEFRLEVLTNLVERGTPVEIRETIRACRDPKDDMILELAVAGRAACIVTGDADLLVLHPFRSIPILTPRDFLDRAW